MSKAPATKKAPAAKKPKCQALTAKGTPCSKCAADGSPFCAVHDPEKSKAKSGDKAKALDKSVPASVKHAHGLDELDYENCELCKSHGGPFELPEYEVVPVEPEPESDVDLDDETADPDFDPESGSAGGLSEEDFDEED